MGNKGPKKHLKRHRSPSFWPIQRKSSVWAVKPSPGPHGISVSIPINIILRDMLKYALTSKEAKRIIKEGKFLVDGKVRLNEKFPVGIMDVIQLLDTNENFRLLPDHKGNLKLHLISQEESNFKLCRINGKTSISKGKTQLNLHDGKNIIIPIQEDNYRINDVLKINIREKEILDHIMFKEMTNCIIIGGRSKGIIGIITRIGQEPGWKKIVDIRTLDGENIRTLARYVFVVGKNEPLISLKEID